VSDHATWYLDERAEQFAILLLTRLDNVHVERRAEHRNVDLWVTIQPEQHDGRIFGVEVKAVRKLSSFVNSNGMVKKDRASGIGERIHDYPFPIGLLIVDVVSDIARFGWVLKPETVVPRFTGQIHTDVATTDVIRRAVDEVLSWYSRR